MSISFHQVFVNRISNDDFLPKNLLESLQTDAPTTIRKHPLKTNQLFEGEQHIEWCEHAFQLSTRPNFTLQPLFHTGCFYPQEAGSMLLDTALKSLDLPRQARILDLCAAPGGKSTLIASYLDGNGILVSNEVINQRAKILKENMTKWGYSNCVVTNNDPSDFERIPNFFDVIVVDAPCSGEGMFRKDPKSRDEWSPENVDLCSGRQRRIVSDVWTSLAENGYLIYSTCTFNAQENEENIAWIVKEFDAELISLEVPKEFTDGRNGVGAYGFPGTSETEGFFLAVVRKRIASDNKVSRKNSSSLARQKDLMDLSNFAAISESDIYFWNNQLLAVPQDSTNDFLTLQANFHIVKWGTNLGEIARKGIIPHHELAMNPRLMNFAHSIEVTRQQALEYLHGDTFVLQGAQGFQLIRYENEPLGWIKNLGNRFNNLYPKEWRIRMDVK